MSHKNHPLLRRYAIVLPAVAAAGLLAYQLSLLVEPRPYLVFLAAVMLATWYGGMGPGLVTTALSVLLSDYLFLPHDRLLLPTTLDAGVNLALFALSAVFISALGESLRRHRREADHARECAEVSAQRLRDSERRYRQIVNTAGEGLWALDGDGRTQYVNRRLGDMLGYNTDELPGRTLVSFVDEAYRGEAQNLFERQKQGLRAQHDLLLRRRDGKPLWVLAVASPLQDDNGVFHGAMFMLTDITERRQAEEALQERVRQQDAVVEVGRLALEGGSLDTLLQQTTETVARTMGVEFCKILELLPDRKVLLVRAGVGFRPGVVGQALVTTEPASHAGYTLHCGHPVIVEDLRSEKRFRGMPLLHEHGVISGVSTGIYGPRGPFGLITAHSSRPHIFTADDIRFLTAVSNVLAAAIERKHVDDVLTAERNWSRTTLSSIGDAVITTDVRGRVTFMNRVAEACTGWTQAEANGRDLAEVFRIVNEHTRESVESPALEVMRAGEIVGLADQTVLLARDGRAIPIDDSGAPIRAQDGTVSGVVLVFRDVTERKRAETALRESREQLEVILRNISEGITVQAPSGQMIFVNEAAAQLVGFASAEAFQDAVPDEIVRNFELMDEAGGPFALEQLPSRVALGGLQPPPVVLRFRSRATREERYSIVDSTPVFGENGQVRFAVTVFRDITHRKRLEERQSFLAEASDALAASLDYETTLASVARLAVPHVADWCAVHIVDEESGAVRVLAVAHADPNKVEWARELQRRYPPDPHARSGVAAVLRSGRPELVSEVPDTLLASTARDEQHLHLLREAGLASYMCVPLVLHGRVLGTLTFVSAESGRRYDQNDLALAEDLAHRAATAVDNARLYGDAQVARAEAETAERRAAFLAEASTALASSPDYENALAQIVRLAVPEVADWGVVLLKEQDQSMRTLAVAHADPAKAELLRTMLRRYPLDWNSPDDRLRELLTGGEVRVFPQYAPERLERGARDEVQLRMLREIGIASLLAIPLVVRGAAIGGMVLVMAASGRAYGPSDAGLAEDLARRIGIAVDNAWLYRRAQSARSEAEAAQQRSAFLAEASRVLSSSLDYESTLGDVARLAVPMVASVCVIALRGEEDGIDPLAVIHVDPDRAARMRADWQHHPGETDGFATCIARVMRSGQAELVQSVPDLQREAESAAPNLQRIRDEGIDSYLCVPLVVRGETLGVISLLQSDPRRCYREADLALAEDLARRAALAVDNARLYRETQDALRARERFLLIASHELRTPVTVLQGYTQGLLRLVERRIAHLAAQAGAPAAGETALDPMRLVGNLRKMEQAIRRLTSLIDELLDVTRFLQDRPLDVTLERTDLAALLSGAVEDLRTRQSTGRYPGNVALSLELPSGAVWGMWDRGRLEQVIVNLLENAVKYSPAGGQVKVRLAVDDRSPDGLSGRFAHVTVRDQGIGIPADQQSRLFQPFMRATNASTRNFPGLGLGLAISKEIVDHHQGYIWAESAGPDRGSAFHVVLPAAVTALNEVPMNSGD